MRGKKKKLERIYAMTTCFSLPLSLTFWGPDAPDEGHHLLSQREEGHVGGGGPGEVKLLTHTHQQLTIHTLHQHLTYLATLTLRHRGEGG